MNSQTPKQFILRIFIEKIETKNNPLFTKSKLYLNCEEVKQYFEETSNIKNNKIVFNCSRQFSKIYLTCSDIAGKYNDFFVQLVVEFEVNGRFVRMGEVSINLAEILNYNRNNETLSYRIDKCYDKTAKLYLSLSLTPCFSKTQSRFPLELHNRDHSRSHRQFYVSNSHKSCLSAKKKSRKKSNMKVRMTQFSNQKEEYSHQINSQSDEDIEVKTKVNKQNLQIQQKYKKLLKQQDMVLEQFQNVEEENHFIKAQLEEKNSQNQYLQHEMSKLSTEYTKIKHKSSELVIQKASKQEIVNILKIQHEKKQKLRVNHENQLRQELNKFMEKYQQSQGQKLKLSFEVNKLSCQLVQKVEQISKYQSMVSRKQIMINEKDSKVHEIMTMKDEILSNLQNKQKKVKELECKIDKLQIDISKTIKQKQIHSQQLRKSIEKFEELTNQVELSRFSNQQKDHQVAKERQEKRRYKIILEKVEAQLQDCKRDLKFEKSKLSQKMKQLEMYSEKNMQKFEQQLEIRTINQNNQTQQITYLKRDIQKYKNALSFEKENTEELETKVEEYQNTIQLLNRQNSKLKAQIFKEVEQCEYLERELLNYQSKLQSERNSTFINEFEIDRQKEKEQIITTCYTERDDYWKRQIQEIEKDTRILIEKNQRDRSDANQKYKVLLDQVHSKDQELKILKQKFKRIEEKEKKTQASHKQIDLQIQLLRNRQKDLSDRIKIKERENSEQEIKLSELVNLQSQICKLKQKYSKKQIQIVQSRQELTNCKNKTSQKLSQFNQIITFILGFVDKSEKCKIYFEEYRSLYIDQNLTYLINNSLKKYVEKHNRVREYLQQNDLQRSSGMMNRQKQPKSSKITSGQKFVNSIFENISEPKKMKQLRLLVSHPLARKSKIQRQSDEQQNENLRKIQTLKKKLNIQKQKKEQLEQELERQVRRCEDKSKEIKRLKQNLESQQQYNDQIKQKLTSKNRNIEKLKQQISQLKSEISGLKRQVQKHRQNNNYAAENRILPMKRSSNNFNKTFTNFSKNEKCQQNEFKIKQLERKLSFSNQQLQKIKRQKQELKNDNSMHQKQLKLLQSKIKQKEKHLNEIKKQMEQMRDQNDKQFQITQLKNKKAKTDFCNEIAQLKDSQQSLNKNLEQQKLFIIELNDKIKKLQQKNKLLTVENQNNKLKNQKQATIMENQFQLKNRSITNHNQNQIKNYNEKINELTQIINKLQEKEKRTTKEIKLLKDELISKNRMIEQLEQEMQDNETRYKTLEEEVSSKQQKFSIYEQNMRYKEELRSNARKKSSEGSMNEIQSISSRTYTFQ